MFKAMSNAVRQVFPNKNTSISLHFTQQKELFTLLVSEQYFVKVVLFLLIKLIVSENRFWFITLKLLVNNTHQ